MFESIQISGFLNNFWHIRQTFLSGTGFSKRMVQLKKTISRVYSHIQSRPENFIHIAWAFVLNKFGYCRRDILLEPLIYWQPVQFWKCSFDICSLLCNFKQNLMDLFCVTCSLFFSFFDKFGYHAYFSLELIFLITLRAIVSPDIDSSNMHLYNMHIQTYIYINTYL